MQDRRQRSELPKRGLKSLAELGVIEAHKGTSDGPARFCWSVGPWFEPTVYRMHAILLAAYVLSR